MSEIKVSKEKIKPCKCNDSRPCTCNDSGTMTVEYMDGYYRVVCPRCNWAVIGLE